MKFRLRAMVLPVAAACTLSGPAMATNGYFTHGVGTHSKALAGAGDASPEMAIDAANNPAAGVLVGESLDLGIALFSPDRKYEAGSSFYNGEYGTFTLDPGTYTSDNKAFPIPYIAKNWKLSDTSALTVSFYGRGGMNTEYNTGSASFDPDGPGPAPVMSLEGTYGMGRAGVDLMQAFLEISYSVQVGDVSLGFAPVFAYQMFKAEGVGAFAPYTKTYAEAYLTTGQPAMPGNLTNNGSDASSGFGFKVGAIYQATDALSISVAYQSEIDMEEFDDYSDLFAEGGDFDIPASARLGLSYQAAPDIKIHFDVEQSYFSDVASVGNPLSNVAACPTAGMGGMDLESCLGGSRGFGFGWDDVTVYQVGVEFKTAADMTWKLGYSQTEQPIQKADALINVLAPAVMEQHITAGFAMERDNGHTISMAFMYAPENSVVGPNLFEMAPPPYPAAQNVTLTMSQYEIEFAYSF